jgi:hypothetical protein
VWWRLTVQNATIIVADDQGICLVKSLMQAANRSGMARNGAWPQASSARKAMLVAMVS